MRINSGSRTAQLIEALKPLQHLPLFYPCSGNDLAAPIKTFAPYIKEFWFADVNYFRYGNYKDVRPVLAASKTYELTNVTFPSAKIEEIDWKDDRHYEKCPPVIRRETYLHRVTGEPITVNRHKRTGPSALRTEISALGVFYYRGDSDEGGSATHWLTIRRWNNLRSRRRTLRKGALIFEVLDKLVDGGLLVTDGSMCKGFNNPYKELQRFHSNCDIGSQAVEEVQPFTDPMGRTFRCIGYAGECYGPTLIWQVSQGA